MTEHIETEVVICEECEDVDSSVFCTNCGQRLCSQCDMRIHNKGNRLLHKRLPIVIANPMSTEQQSKQQNEQSQQQQLNGQCIDNIMENISNNNNNGQSQSQQQQQQQQDDSGVVATPKESVNAISLNETSSQQAETPRMKGWSPTQANSQSNNQGADEYDKNMPILSNNNNNNDGISNSNQFSQQSTEGLLTHGDNQTAFKQQQQQLLMLMMQYQQQQLLTNQQQQHQQQQDKVFTQQGHSQQQYQQPQSFSLSNSNQQQSLSLPNLQSGQQQQQSQQYQSPFSLPSQQQQQMLLLQLHQQLQYQALQQQQQQQSHNHPQQQPPHQIPQFFSNSPQANRMFDTQHSTQANLLQANLSTSVDSSYESTHIPPAHEFLFGSSFFAPNLLSQQQQQQQSQQILVEPSPTASRQNKTFNVSMDHFSFGEEQDNNNASFLSNKTLASNIPVNPIEIPLRQDLSHFDSKDVHMEITKKLLLERAKQGDLLIKIDSFKESFEKEIGKGQFVNTEKIIRSLESKEIIHCTTRKFGDSEPISYLSLKLSGISIECLVWIIESIRRDEMTPTDKMVLSRLKECYAVKINQLYWNGVLLYIKSLADINGDVILNTPLLPNLKLKRVQDAVTLVDSFLIYTKVNNSAWVHADNGPVQESDRDLWRIFIEFLKEFFYENTENGNGNNGGINDNNNNNNDGSNNNNFQNALKQQQQVQPSQKHKWTSSVENVHTKTTKKTLVRPPKSISKAIPGGRYGCAQLLKCCGPLPLRSCSLGKLSLFVQEAISKGILVYYKTLLIKPTNFDFDEVMDISVLDSQLSQQQQQQQSQQHQQQKSSSSSSQGCVGMQQQRCESESGNVTDIVTDIIQISNNNSDQQMNQSAQNNSASFNHHMQTSVSEEKLSKEQVEKIAVVKLTILEILSENASGVSLARLPKLIQKKIEFAFDLHELGFPKLKSLLQTVHGVAIEKDGTTQAQAVLKNENSNGEESVEDREIFNEQSIGTSKDFSNLESQQHQYQFIHLYPQQQQSSSAQSQYHKAFKVPAAKEKINQNNNIKPTGRFFAKSDDTGAQQLQQQHYNDTQNLNGSSQNSNNNNNSGSNNSNNSSNNNNNNSNNLNNNNQRDLSPQSYNRKFCTLKPERPQAKKIQPIAQNGRTFSNLEDYRSKVIETIQSILKDNPSGLISHKLNELLNQKLNAQFQLSLFGCVNFNEFLVKFTESFADILVKQSNYIIYAKNSHMNPLTLRQILNQNNNINANNNNNTNNSHSLNQFNNQQGQGSQQQQYQQQFQQPQQSQTSQFQQNHSPLAQNNTNNLRMSSSCNSSFLSSPPQWKNNNNESFIVQNNSQISQSFSACSVNVTGGNNNQPSEINNQLQNESHTDIEVNLKFIEELLNDEDKGNLNSGHHRRYSSNSTGTFHAFKGCYDNNIFYNQLKSPNNYHTQRKYSPLYSNDFPEIIHEEPNHLNYNNNNNNVIVNHNNNVNTNNNNLGNKYCPPQPSQFGHMPPASKSMNLELQGLTLAYQAALQGDKGKQKLRHKTLNYQK